MKTKMKKYGTRITYSTDYSVEIDAPDTLTSDQVEEFLSGFIDWTGTPELDGEVEAYINSEYSDDELLAEYKKIKMTFDCVDNETFINRELSSEGEE